MKKAAVFFQIIFVCCLLFKSTNAQSWQSLGTGVNFSVYALEVDTIRDELYVGGWFTNAGGIPTNGIAKWDGINWHSLNGGTNYGGQVRTIFYFNNEIYVGGSFDSIGGIAAKNIAKWNHSVWQAIGEGFNNVVTTITSFNSEIYCGGHFDSSGIHRIPYISRWDGIAWQNLNSGLNGEVFTMIPFGNELIIGGDFNRADTLSVGRVVKWSGNDWNTIGAGFNSFVRDLYSFNGVLHASGDFYFNAPSYIRYIARWDGANWNSLTAPGVIGSFSPGISDMIEFNGQLHFTGDFTSPRYVAKYNNSTLDSLDHGVSWAGSSLEIYKGDLIIGGYFAFAGNQVTNTSGIARWVLSTSIIEDNKYGHLISIHASQSTQGLLIPQWSNGSGSRIKIYDLQGRFIKEISLNNSDLLELINISSGIYIYHLSNSYGKSMTGKILIN